MPTWWKTSILSAIVLAGLTTTVFAQSHRLTFAEAAEMSLDRGLEIAGARHGATAAALRASGTGAQRYPKLRAEANLLRWDTPIQIAFGDMSMPGSMPSRLIVRDRFTSLVAISLAQPISGLFVLNRMVAIDRSGADAALADVARARLDAVSRAAESYLKVLQAIAFEDVAGKSLAQLEAQLAKARVLEQGGVLGKVDVLRLTSSRDEARQSLLRTRTNVQVARGALALALNLPPEATVDVVDDLPDPPPPIATAESEALREAIEKRPEIRSAIERSRQARGGQTVALAQLLPNVMAVGTYQHVEGQGPFQPRNAWFIGATLTWDIWDWGKTWDGVNEARARATQAELAEKFLRDQIAFEARRRLLEARAAFETLAPARSSLEAAEEAHRIQTVRYAQGVASTTDVIDAETGLARARSGYAQARYDYYLAQAALARAVGDLPSQPPAGAVRPASRRSD